MFLEEKKKPSLFLWKPSNEQQLVTSLASQGGCWHSQPWRNSSMDLGPADCSSRQRKRAREEMSGKSQTPPQSSGAGDLPEARKGNGKEEIQED